MVERGYLSKPLFDELVERIEQVLQTFKPETFPAATSSALLSLKTFLEQTFLREVVRTGSDEYSATLEFINAIDEFCLNTAMFAGKDFVEARKTFSNEIFIFRTELQEIENHPAHKWKSFAKLTNLAKEWAK